MIPILITLFSEKPPEIIFEEKKSPFKI